MSPNRRKKGRRAEDHHPKTWKEVVYYLFAEHTWKMVSGIILIIVVIGIFLTLSIIVTRDSKGNLKLENIKMENIDVKGMKGIK